MSNLIVKIGILTATLGCNLNCPWCARDQLNKKYNLSTELMSVETAKKILQKYPDFYQVVLTGGEPMLNLPLLEYVCQAAPEEIKVSTNGTIGLEDLSILNGRGVHFDISMNSIERPLLYRQLLKAKYPGKNIRLFVYLNRDWKKVVEIIDTVGHDDFRGYEILPDIWTKEDPEYEKIIIESAPAFAELQLKYQKDDGYVQYLNQGQGEPPILKFKFSPQGEIITDLWTQGLPSSECKKEFGKIYNDQEVMRRGKEHFNKGIKSYNVPVEYYTALMYEEMNKYIVSLQ